MNRFKLSLLTPQFRNYTTYYLHDVLTDFTVQEQSYRTDQYNDENSLHYDPLQHQQARNYSYDEKVTRVTNSQATLTFKMTQFITRENEWLENPFLHNIAVGSRLVLEEIDNNGLSHTTLFVVTKIKYNFSETNSVYDIECEDAFTYYTIRQHINYSIENDPATSDFIGAHDIDWWTTKKIVPECHLTYDYLSLSEGLALLSDGTLLRFQGSNLTQGLLSAKNLTHHQVVSIIKFPYDPIKDADYFQTWSFSCSNVTTNQALKQLASQLDFQIKTYEYPDNAEGSSRIYRKLFWFEPTHNDQRLGLTYSPKNTIQNFGLTQSGDNLTTVLNVANHTINDEVIAMIPAIPPFFRTAIMLNQEWENTSFYPGFFWAMCHDQEFAATTASPESSQWQIDLDAEHIVFTSFTDAANITHQVYCMPVRDKHGSFLHLPSGYETIYFRGIGDQWPQITVNEDIDTIQLRTNRSSPWGVHIRCYAHNTEEAELVNEYWVIEGQTLPTLPSDSFFKLDFFIEAPINFTYWRDPKFLFQWHRTSSVEEEQFAEIADACPWLENKLIDFNFFYKNRVLSKNEYKELTQLLQDNLRIVNGRLLIYTEAYYNALHARTKILSTIQTELDLLGAACQADILDPIITSGGLKKTLTQTDFYQKYMNYCSRLNGQKTAIIDWEDLLSDYFNKTFDAEQRFLKNAYDFRNYFNASISLQDEYLYKYTFTIDDRSWQDSLEGDQAVWYSITRNQIRTVNRDFKYYIGASLTDEEGLNANSLYNYGAPTVALYQLTNNQYIPLEVVHQGNFQNFYVRNTLENQLRLGTTNDRYNAELQYYYLVFQVDVKYKEDTQEYYFEAQPTHPIGLTGTNLPGAYTGNFSFTQGSTTYTTRLIKLQRQKDSDVNAIAAFQVYCADENWHTFITNSTQVTIHFDDVDVHPTEINYTFQAYSGINEIVRSFLETGVPIYHRQRPLYLKDRNLWSRAEQLARHYPNYVLPGDANDGAESELYWRDNLPINEVYYKGPVYNTEVYDSGNSILWHRLNRQGQTQADYARYLLDPSTTVVENPYEYEAYQQIPFVTQRNKTDYYHHSIKPNWIKIGLTILGVLAFPYFPVAAIGSGIAAAMLPYTYHRYRNDDSAVYYPAFYTDDAVEVVEDPWYSTKALFMRSTSSALNQAALTFSVDASTQSMYSWQEDSARFIWQNLEKKDDYLVLTPPEAADAVEDMVFYSKWKWLAATAGMVREESSNLFIKDTLLEALRLNDIVEPQRTYKVLRTPNAEGFWELFKPSVSNSVSLVYPFVEAMADIVFTGVSKAVPLSEALTDIGYTSLSQDSASGQLYMQLNGTDYHCYIFKLRDYHLASLASIPTSYNDLYNANDVLYVWTEQPIINGCFILDNAAAPEKVKLDQFDMTQTYYDDNNVIHYTIQQIINGAISAIYFNSNSYSCYAVTSHPEAISIPLIKHTAHVVADKDSAGNTIYILDRMTTDDANISYQIDASKWGYSSQTTQTQTVPITIQNTTFNLEITQSVEAALHGLTNGTFWWLYHERADIPFLQEQAAIIETQLTNYWNQMLAASKYCDYFLPDSWLPATNSSINPYFAEQMEVHNSYRSQNNGTELTIPSCSYVGPYVPQVALYQQYQQTQLPSYNIRCSSEEIGLHTLTSIGALQNPALQHIIQLLDINPDNWTAEENGTRTYYYAVSGGITWKEFLTSHISCNCANYSGWYVMLFNYLKQAYMPRSLPSYREYQKRHDNLWKELYDRFPGILLQTNYQNESAVSSWDLFNLAKYAFKSLSQPEADYSITVIQAYELEGKVGQELRIGDGIQIKAQDFYNEYDQVYNTLSQYLFISQISYSLRDASSMSLTVNDVQYDNKLIRRLAKLMK